jgi:hypothetical protein
MKKISAIRKALDHIPDSRMKFDPEEDFLGNQDGVQVNTIWDREGAIQDTNEASLLADDSLNDKNNKEAEDNRSLYNVPQIEPIFEFGADIDDKQPLLSGDKEQQIKKSIELKGMDALAAYLSFHVDRAQWGIYIPESSIEYMVNNCFPALPARLETKRHLAFHSLLSHELFHFATDYMVAQFEMIWRESIWIGMREQLKKRKPRYWEREEKLANAYMLRSLRMMGPDMNVKGKLGAMRSFFADQPSGYREGGKVRSWQWDEELKQLAHDYFFSSDSVFLGEADPLRLEFPIDFSALYPLNPRIDWRYCTIHVLNDQGGSGLPKIYLNPFTRIQNIVETDSFLRELRQLPKQIQKKWYKFKRLASTELSSNNRPKKWPPLGEDSYSVKIDDNYRAHLRVHSGGQKWTTIGIGNHAEMGHG